MFYKMQAKKRENVGSDKATMVIKHEMTEGE